MARFPATTSNPPPTVGDTTNRADGDDEDGDGQDGQNCKSDEHLAPLLDCSSVAQARDPLASEVVEFNNDLYAAINDIGSAAFRAAGHSVIDLECMLGQRIDAHGIKDGIGDALHFCLPGPIDLCT